MLLKISTEPHEAIRAMQMAMIRDFYLTKIPPFSCNEVDDQRTLTFETKLALAALRKFETQAEFSEFERKSKEYLAYNSLVEAIKRAEAQFEREINEITGRVCDGSLRDDLETSYEDWLEIYKNLKEKCYSASIDYNILHYKNPIK